jgi:hypothetical protein
MRVCARQASAKLTLFSRLIATSGATNRQGLFRLVLHNYRVQHRTATRMFNCDQCIHVKTPAFLRVIKTVFSSVSASGNENFRSPEAYLNYFPEPSNFEHRAILRKAHSLKRSRMEVVAAKVASDYRPPPPRPIRGKSPYHVQPLGYQREQIFPTATALSRSNA